MNLAQFDQALSNLCTFIGAAAMTDIRTEFLGRRIAKVKGALGVAGLSAPTWAKT
jgi:hypothetical protein